MNIESITAAITATAMWVLNYRRTHHKKIEDDYNLLLEQYSSEHERNYIRDGDWLTENRSETRTQFLTTFISKLESASMSDLEKISMLIKIKTLINNINRNSNDSKLVKKAIIKLENLINKKETK